MGNAKKTALITGINGQDGAYLAEFLLSKGYTVYGSVRQSSVNNTWRLEELGIHNQVHLIHLELTEFSNVLKVIEKIKIDEIYNLAAQSFVKMSFEQPVFTGDVDGLGVARLLDAIRIVNPKIKFYQASTSEMFGKIQITPQNETTPFHPRSPYGVAKVYGHLITQNYREAYDMFCCSGILFNHESPLRGEEFVTRKITLGLARITNQLQDCLHLGTITPQRDWGYAKEYVQGMWLMLQQDKPEDYVLATGKTHSIKHFIEIAAEYLDIDLVWKETENKTIGLNRKTNKRIVETDPTFSRPADIDSLVGNPSKAKAQLNWEAKTQLKELIHTMLDADLKRIQKR